MFYCIHSETSYNQFRPVFCGFLWFRSTVLAFWSFLGPVWFAVLPKKAIGPRLDRTLKHYLFTFLITIFSTTPDDATSWQVTPWGTHRQYMTSVQLVDRYTTRWRALTDRTVSWFFFLLYIFLLAILLSSSIQLQCDCHVQPQWRTWWQWVNELMMDRS